MDVEGDASGTKVAKVGEDTEDAELERKGDVASAEEDEDDDVGNEGGLEMKRGGNHNECNVSLSDLISLIATLILCR